MYMFCVSRIKIIVYMLSDYLGSLLMKPNNSVEGVPFGKRTVSGFLYTIVTKGLETVMNTT